MILISTDVSDPTVKPFAVADKMITNPNGSVSFVNADGSVVGQEPMNYGMRHDAPNVEGMGVYQMFTYEPGSALVTVQTRPQDPMYVYTVAFGRTY